jgi:class 3 adenylate cyclase
MRPAVPSGVVTFLFTDVEGSTRLWAADSDAMSASLRVHDDVLRDAIESRGGYVFTTAGDSFAAAFSQASAAVEAAVAMQAELAVVEWPGPALRIRIGLHLGEAEERGGDYFGPVVNASARVEAAGHGGQIVVTAPVQSVVAHDDVVPLGEHQLRDLPEPLELFQIGAGEFPPLRGLGGAQDHLPTLRSRLLGRDREVGELARLLETERLVTLVGPGGIGKTSVAIETAGKLSERYPGGVHFVDLAAVTEGDGVVGAVCRGVQIVATTSPYEQLVEFLSANATLLVVDNCEHLIDDAAEIVDRLLDRRGGRVGVGDVA